MAHVSENLFPFLFSNCAFKMDQRFVTLCVRAIIHPCVLRKDKIFGVKTIRFFTQGIFCTVNKEIFYYCVFRSISVYFRDFNIIFVYKNFIQIHLRADFIICETRSEKKKAIFFTQHQTNQTILKRITKS